MSEAAAIAGDRRGLARLVTVGLAVLFVCVILASLAIGPYAIRVGSIPGLLLDGLHRSAAAPLSGDQIILYNIRLPRTLLGAAVGAALAVAGCMMQGLFRNPLADPGLVGVSSGSALGAVIALAGGGPFVGLVRPLGMAAVPICAFIGGLSFTLALYGIATRQGRTSVATMLLAGIALGALAGAGTGFMVYVSNDDQLRDLTFWLLGGLGGATWKQLAIALPLICLVLLVMPFIASGLDRLVLGEAQARHLGVRVQLLKRVIIFLVATGVAASVAMAGVIGFVGIVAPHLLRLLIGPEHRMLLPASALFGACLVISADVLARTVVSPAELPIGILTAAIGAPFFLFILLRNRTLVDL